MLGGLRIRICMGVCCHLLAPRGPRVLCCQWLKSNANRPVLEDACRAKKLEFTKKTTRFQLAQLLHPELPDFCENHEHKRR